MATVANCFLVTIKGTVLLMVFNTYVLILNYLC